MDPESARLTRPRSLSQWMRARFKTVLDPIAGFFNRLGLAPNTITLFGLAGNALASVLLAMGETRLGGLVVLVMGPIDALDGAMARLRGEPTNFGAFVDSVTDRWSELLILGGVLTRFALEQNPLGVILSFAAAVGSVMVSYSKARAEALKFECDIGLLTRLERYLVLSPALILNVPLVGVGIIAIFANITAMQRILFVRAQARRVRRE
ncbi:MAG: CDP-alcohol phosphatidyltransferase family protein [Anaerolineales bacterium]